MDAIGRAYSDGFNAILEAGKALGVSATRAILEGLTFDKHTFSILNKSAEEISDMIESGITQDLDKAALAIAPYLKNYEGLADSYIEILIKTVYEMELLDSALGDIGGGFNYLGEQAIAVSQAFIEASGGMDNALENIQGYIDNFYTDTEKQAIRADKIDWWFPDAEAYREQVEKLTASVEAPVSVDSYAAINQTSDAVILANLLENQELYAEYFEYLDQLAIDSLSPIASNVDISAARSQLNDTYDEGVYLSKQLSLRQQEHDLAQKQNATALELADSELAILDARLALKEFNKNTINDLGLALDYTESSTGFEASVINRTGDDEAIAAYAITAANKILKDTIALTELYGITADNYLSKFEAANKLGLSDEDLANWQQLGDAITSAEDASSSYANLLDSIPASIQAIADAWLGNLSYLDIAQKAQYAEGYAAIAGYSDQLDGVAGAKSYAESAFNATTTKEDYIPAFEKYILELQDEVPLATTDDVVFRLDELIDAVREGTGATTAASYQDTVTSNIYYNGV